MDSTRASAAAFIDGGGVRGAAHFSRPEDDGFIQHSALVQVGDEGGDGLLGDAGILFVIQLELSVLVPWRVVAIATVSKF